MEDKLDILYNVLSFYKCAVINQLEKIDETISRAINSSKHDTHTLSSIAKKFCLSLEMATVLKDYMKILYSAECLSNELVSKLTEFEHDSEPERDVSRSSNPFVSYFFNEQRESENQQLFPDLEVKTEFQGRPSEPAVSSCSDTETETIVGALSESGDDNLLDRGESVTSNAEFCNVEDEMPKAVTDVKPIVKDEIMELYCTSEKVEELGEVEEPDKNLIIKVKAESQNSQQNNPLKKKKTVKIKEPTPPSTPTRAHPETKTINYSAIIKLLEMPMHDRRREAEKQFENKAVKKQFQLTVGKPRSKSPSSHDSRKKAKDKYVHYELLDDDLRVGQNCTFCHIVSPSEFYLWTNQRLIEALDSSLNEEMNSQHQWVVNKFKSKYEAKVNLGNFCVGFLISKQKWFRVHVLDWLIKEPTNIVVQLVDYGEKTYLKYENLKPLNELFACIPKMAIKCHFACIESPDPYGWPQASINGLKSLSKIKEQTTFVTIFVHREGSSYAVDLTNDEFGSATLGIVLVETNLAREIKIITDEDILEEGLEDYENITEAITGYNAQDEARICPFTDKTGRCFKGPQCKLEHGQLSHDGITTDKILTVNEALVKIEMPSVDSTILILITGYINTCHFYAHWITNPSGTSQYNVDFQRLMKTMNSNSVVQTFEKFKIFPGIGELVLVKEDSEWYRGRCIAYKGQDKEEQFEIFLVDYGYSRVKTVKDLRQMKEDFLHVPFQAIECMIDNVREKKDTRIEDSQNFFFSCMSMKTFTARVTDSREPLIIQLWDQDSMDMGYVLDSYGLAEQNNLDFFPENGYLSCV